MYSVLVREAQRWKSLEKKVSRGYCKNAAVFQLMLEQISCPNHPSLLNPGAQVWIMWLSTSKGHSSVCLCSWEVELLLCWGKNMDNFLASVRGQPADGIWEVSSWLQQGRSDTSALASGCSGVVAAMPCWSSGAEGVQPVGPLLKEFILCVCTCHWMALGIWSWIWKLLILKTLGHSCPCFRCELCLTSELQRYR